jgi:hypothetical protein
MPNFVLDALQTMTCLSAAPIGEFMAGRNLVIDDFYYSLRINGGEIVYIVYDKSNDRLLQWDTFDTLANFEWNSIELSRENNRRYMLEYLDGLLCDNLIVLMSVREEASADLDAGILEKLSELGLTRSLEGRFAYSYAAIINGRTVVYENLSRYGVEQIQLVERWLIKVLSEGGLSGRDISRIKIDGVDYSGNHRGINIVVLNKRTGLIEDSITFDTHSDLAVHRG